MAMGLAGCPAPGHCVHERYWVPALDCAYFTAPAHYVHALHRRRAGDLDSWTRNIGPVFYIFERFSSGIKFTMERTDKTHNGQIPLLDTLITVQDDGTYSTELYIKPMASPIIIHYTSAHPIQCKRSVLHSQLLRAKRLGSNREAQERGMFLIETFFRHNGYGYPNRLIQRTKHCILRDATRRHLGSND